MVGASWTGDLEGLTPLIIAILLFAAAVIFRKEIKSVLSRLASINLKRGDTHLEADLSKTSDAQTRDVSAVSDAATKDSNGVSDDAESVLVASEPDEDADVTQVRSQMMQAYMDGDQATGDAKYAELASLESDPAESKKDQARKYATQVIGGIDAKGIESLKSMIKDDEHAGFIYRMMGIAYNATERPEEASEAFLQARLTSSSAVDAATAAQFRSEVLGELGRIEPAESELVELLLDASDEDAIAVYWSALAVLYEKAGKVEPRALALHEVARAKGNNAEAWFKAGYAYSDVEADHLTILVVHCYANALYFDAQHRWALNNLGVALEGAHMPLLGVERYRKAAALGNTLSMANLASKLLNAGFQDEAEELLKKASEYKEPHENVASVKASVGSKRKEQQEKFNGIRGAGTRAGHFLTNYARRKMDLAPSISGDWKVESVDAVIDSKGKDNVSISWEEDTYKGHRRFTGTLTGGTLYGRFETEGSSSWEPDEISWTADGVGYGVFSADGAKLSFLKLTKDEAVYLDFQIQSKTL